MGEFSSSTFLPDARATLERSTTSLLDFDRNCNSIAYRRPPYRRGNAHNGGESKRGGQI